MWSSDLSRGRCDEPYISHANYPTDELRAVLQAVPTSIDAGPKMLEAAAEYFNAYNPGSAWLEGKRWSFATGGWSGCEEVIELLMVNFATSMLWESSHRGGLHVFVVRG